MSKNSCQKVTVFILLVVIFSLYGCSNNMTSSKSLSEYALGEWNGQVDVAKIMYKSLGDELGIELAPDPEYCDMSLYFNDDNTCTMSIDTDGFATAVGNCVKPYVSAIIGFDTSMFVDVIMQYVAKDMPVESGTEECTYEVGDEQQCIIVSDDNGNENTFYLMKDGTLQYEDQEIGQVFTFYKE